MTKPISQILREARELIREPKKWCKGVLQWPPEDDWGSHCVMGAVHKVMRGSAAMWRCGYRGLPDEATVYLARAAGVEPTCESVATWNNAEYRTHSDIMAAFGRAIDLAEAHEASALHSPSILNNDMGEDVYEYSPQDAGTDRPVRCAAD